MSGQSPDWLMPLSSLLLGCSVFLLLTSVGPVWGMFANRRIADLAARLEAVRWDTTSLPFYMRCWGLAMIGVFIFLGVILGMFPVAIVAVYLIYVSPRLVLEVLLQRRRYLLRDQLVATCVALANASRAGLSLGEGLAAITKETPEPLAGELGLIIHEFRSGRPLADAIQDAKDRMQLDSFTLFSTAILVALERGGRITEALERISASLQENQRLERKLEADTASGRKVVITLAVFPFLFLAVFSFLDPRGTGLVFHSFVGQILL